MFAEVEFMEFHRREPFQGAMVKQLLKQCNGFDEGQPGAMLSTVSAPSVGGSSAQSERDGSLREF